MPIVAKKPATALLGQEAPPKQRRVRLSPEILLERASKQATERESHNDLGPVTNQTEPAAKTKRRRGVAKKDKNGKYLPCDAPVGFANPPQSGKFQKGNRGGGRPKGARSQDSIKREKLNQKEAVTLNGKTRKVSRRELAEEMLHKKAFENGGNAKLLTQISTDAMRLFAETANDNGKSSFFGDPALDDQLLRSIFAVFQMGEPSPNGFDPATLTGTPIADFTGSGDVDGWDEGEWQAGHDAQQGAEDAEDDDD